MLLWGTGFPVPGNVTKKLVHPWFISWTPSRVSHVRRDKRLRVADGLKVTKDFDVRACWVKSTWRSLICWTCWAVRITSMVSKASAILWMKKKMKNFSLVKSIDQTLPTKCWRSGGAGNGLWSCRFSAFHDRPS